jgi:ATP-dependent RNA helicase SUPV3L1/SUV3
VGASQLEDKALRAAAIRAVGPQLAKRLGALAAAPDSELTLDSGGAVRWQGAPAGRISGGTPFAPVVKLYGELGPQTARERAERRMEAWLAAAAAQTLWPLKALDDALAGGEMKGLARGIAYRLREANGVLDRRVVAEQVKALSPRERRMLKGLGVRFAAFSVHSPALQGDEARSFALAFERGAWRPLLEKPSRLPDPPAAAAALGVRGLVAAGPFAVPVAQLERLDAHLRAETPVAGASVLTAAAIADLGWEEGVARGIMKGLGFASARKTEPGEPSLWRMKRDRDEAKAAPVPVNPASPFAALAGLKTAPSRRRHRPRKAKRTA